MNDQTDSQLLQAYAENHSEAAFTELVRRHVDFVYSAARRMVCDPHLAEDVTQGVFVAFAQNAHQLTDRPVVSGWLHRTAQNIGSQTVRTIERRRAREEEAVAMNQSLSSGSDETWEHIAPHLDAALGALSEPDRDALLLRYFERKSAREMALVLNVSEEAAQKRVNRAVERLRALFSKRNVTVGASGLIVLISANAVQAAPVALIATIASAATFAVTSFQTFAIKAIAMTTLQKALISAAIIGAVSFGIYEAHQAATLRAEVETLRQQPSPEQRISERHDTASEISALREENKRLSRNTADLLKLRGEMGVLKRKLAEAGPDKAEAITAAPAVAVPLEPEQLLTYKVEQLKQALEQMPYLKIPELQIAEEKWRLAASCITGALKTDEDYRWCFHELRRMAEDVFGNIANDALQKYEQANNGQFPTDISQLKPYFKSPVDDAILQRYEIVPVKVIPKWHMGGDWLLTSKAPVDTQDDREVIGAGGYGHGFPFYSPAKNEKTNDD